MAVDVDVVEDKGEGSERCCIIVLLTANLYCGEVAEVVVEETRALRMVDYVRGGC